MQFRHHICDDLAYRLRAHGISHPTDEQVYDYGLHLLDNILHDSGRSLEEFPPMPLPQDDWNVLAENPFIAEQLNYDRDRERVQWAERFDQLNDDQRHAYNQVMVSVEQNEGQVFFLNGPGGTGKTFVYRTVCHKVRSEGWIALCVASSGVAALLLKGGRTSHSMFKIPVQGLCDTSTCAINKQSRLADMLRRVNVIIWDEVVMQNRFVVSHMSICPYIQIYYQMGPGGCRSHNARHL
ncbi:hypothetical protein FA95DRAFT_1503786 [Auriscalpium vulgare]|uniref:Uncharacterized protein n=1 Tax=Auriscalpium vulgare TaxID=40419 RepID=A0ACB8R6H1_9AGAM|nr:hypothetical protein FA95DRAFT_1503786 [Auriscalpium vulgare]